MIFNKPVFGKRGTIYGGVFLPSAKAATQDVAIEILPPPPRLYLPIPAGAESVVAVGESLAANQPICTAADRRDLVYCPVDGRALGQSTVRPALGVRGRAVTLEVLNSAAVDAAAPADLDWKGFDEQRIAQAWDRCGRPVCRGPVCCTVDDLQEARARGVSFLIINGMESEPCLTGDHRLLVEHAALVVRAAAVLHGYLGVKRTFLAIDRSKKALWRQVVDQSHGLPVRVAGLQNRYPIGTAPLLVQTLLGRELPAHQPASAVGAVVLGLATVYHFARSLAGGVPRTAGVITVCGDAVSRPGNYWVANGTPVAHILQRVGVSGPVARLIAGGPMTGESLADDQVVVTPECPALLVLSSSTVNRVASTACVHCGWCLEVCPTRLDPASLLKCIEVGHLAPIRQLHAEICIECGLCSYVCPSALPLTGCISRARRILSDE